MKREDADKLIAKISKMDFDFGDYYDNTETIQEIVSNAIEEYYKESNPEPKDYEYIVNFHISGDMKINMWVKSAAEAREKAIDKIYEKLEDNYGVEVNCLNIEDSKGNIFE